MLIERLRERLAAGTGFIEPCLASPVMKPPAGSNWIHKIKHDGYRLMALRDPAWHQAVHEERARLDVSLPRRGGREPPPGPSGSRTKRPYV
jgi:hypothetical protein